MRLPIGYIDAIRGGRRVPVVIALGKEFDPEPLPLDRLDSVLLSGLDLDPRQHGLPTHPAVQAMAERVTRRPASNCP